MKRPINHKALAVLVALAWFALAAGSSWLMVDGESIPLFWVPGALAVAVLFSTPSSERIAYLLGIAAASIALSTFNGTSPPAMIGYALANAAEPLVVVVLAKRIMGRRPFASLNLRDLTLLFMSAVLGGAVGSVISSPFQDVGGWEPGAWRILATSLASAVVAPLLVSLFAWVNSRGAPRRGETRLLPTGFWIYALAIFALSLLVLKTSIVSLTPLVLAALVFSVVRYGQLAASTGVFAFGVAATFQSHGGKSPAAFLDFPQIQSALIVQGLMLLMLATCLPLAALLMRHNRLALRLKARNARMRENLLMLNMAEEIGRIGRWRYDPRSGAQDWSRQMYLINGLNPARGRDPGDLMSLLPDGGEELFSNLAHHAKDHARYSFEYRIHPPHSDERILKMHATNEFTPTGELACTFGVVMDVTEHHQRQEALDKERTRAMRLAAEAQYLAHTDPLTGLANRRRTITQLEKCIRRAQQGDRALGLISFDIDHFKRINDENGHQVGDEVLIRVAELARNQARASDLVGRMGGEEFIWILPDVGEGETKSAAERLRGAVEEGSREGGLPPVTISVGFVLWRPGDDVGSVLAKVDAALYAAKAGGRNTVQDAA